MPLGVADWKSLEMLPKLPLPLIISEMREVMGEGKETQTRAGTVEVGR